MKPTLVQSFLLFVLAPWLLTAYRGPAGAAPTDPIPMLEAEIFELDRAHSHLGFTIGFMGLTRVHGTFETYDLAILNNEKDITKLSVTLLINAASINTNLTMRDEDLRSARFFDVETYPRIIFQSQRIEETASGYVMHGSLTMRGITKPVAIPFTKTINRMTDPAWGNVRAGYEGRLKLNRRDFGILGNDFWGNQVLADDVDIAFSILGLRSNFEQWTFTSRDKPSIGDTLMATVARHGHEAALALLRTVRTTAPDAYNTRPRELNLVGRKLLQQGRLDAALAFLSLAVEQAPSAAPFHVAVGEAWAMKGDRQATLHHFQEAFSLEPTHPVAIEVLRRLGQPIDAGRIEEAITQQ